jgi:predicted transcriptional regulator
MILPKSQHGVPLDPILVEKIRELYSTGKYTQFDIARIIGTGQSVVSKYCKILGREIPLSHVRGEWINKQLDVKDVVQLREMYATGKYPQQVLAEKFGISQGMVSKILLKRFWRTLERKPLK